MNQSWIAVVETTIETGGAIPNSSSAGKATTMPTTSPVTPAQAGSCLSRRITRLAAMAQIAAKAATPSISPMAPPHALTAACTASIAARPSADRPGAAWASARVALPVSQRRMPIVRASAEAAAAPMAMSASVPSAPGRAARRTVSTPVARKSSE